MQERKIYRLTVWKSLSKERKGKGRGERENGENDIEICDRILIFGESGDRAYRVSLFYNFLYTEIILKLKENNIPCLKVYFCLILI